MVKQWTLILVVTMMVANLWAQDGNIETVFSEDFTDLALPVWNGRRDPAATYELTAGPTGESALTISAKERVNTTFVAQLPVERIAGKGVLLDVWRRAAGVRTGAEHYHNAKAMLSWKAKSVTKPKYSTTSFSDFSGTFDWERHRYVVEMPEDLEWAAVSIGFQGCSGTASWARLRVAIDPRFPTQQALDRYLAQEERKAYANLDTAELKVSSLDGGIIDVSVGPRHVPRKYWAKVVCDAVLKAVPDDSPALPNEGKTFDEQLRHALRVRSTELLAGLAALNGTAAADRTYEIVSLRARVRQLGRGLDTTPVSLQVDGSKRHPVSPLIFGNNINTQNLSAPYDSERGCFQDEFLRRVRPMGITFLRYPGGCNADVFDWRDTIGPLAGRKDLINYHNGTSRGTPRFGVDEYLRFCEEEGMTPIITTAFCKDHPSKVDANEHPNGVRHPFVFDYLKSAPERVKLASDWVEYCNGAVDTPMGALRAQNGHPKPYGVRYWEVGNESYGPDPAGSCSAEEYARAFPAYAKAMKARDPSISVIMNGGSKKSWNDTILKLAGNAADAFQFHIYLTPRVKQYAKLEGQPHQITLGMRMADTIPEKLNEVEELMKTHLGKTLPVIISEFGMGNARNREFMTSVTSPVLVADMWRQFVESSVVFGANKWCLFTGYWFSQIQGPTLAQPDAPYYNRPEQIMHTVYARCRGPVSLAIACPGDGVKAVIFEREGSYGVVLVSREAVSWQRVTLALPGAVSGKATCLMLTAGHPFLGNENDHDLVRPYEFTFDYMPGQPIAIPSNSVIGLEIPRKDAK